jgi:glycosyltransferase involved in cell wall biosynthesis
MNKILVVGQTPPPIGGQAVMIEEIINAPYTNARIYHVRMAFSKGMDDMGRIQVAKIFHLFSVILHIWYYRIVKGVNILYYPPSGPDKVPVYRDIIILVATRWMFSKTIFHFHAGGLSEFWPRLGRMAQFLFKLAFFYPDATISLSTLVPPDAAFIKSRKQYIIPYGIADEYTTAYDKLNNKLPLRILFMGVMRETKGEFVLLEACRQLAAKGIEFAVDFAGSFHNKAIEQQFYDFVETHQLQKNVFYRGVVSGEDKRQLFASADIFCFPSYFESETFGLVVVEAMQFCLPVVSTNWRGIPGNVANGVNGFLVNIKDAQAVAEKLELLLLDNTLRAKMGANSRAIYLEKFTTDRFLQLMDTCFSAPYNR